MLPTDVLVSAAAALLGRCRGTAAAEIDGVASSTPFPLPPVATTALIRRKSLDDTIASKHASIDREVAAHHEGPHRGVLLRQPIGFVSEIGLVFSTIDEDQTRKAGGTPVRFVQGVTPASTPTQT